VISLIFSYIWQKSAELAQGQNSVLCDLIGLTYTEGAAGSCVPFLPAGYFEKYPSPLLGLAAAQPGPFSFLRPVRVAEAFSDITENQAANAYALQRT
jgi:hypothetical protein